MKMESNFQAANLTKSGVVVLTWALSTRLIEPGIVRVMRLHSCDASV